MQNIEHKKQKENTNKNNKYQLIEELIKMACEDGQLTNRELIRLRENIEKQGFDFEDFEYIIHKTLIDKQKNKETEIIDKNKEKGSVFESYIVNKFNSKYFTNERWEGDKHSNGIYPLTTKYPDLTMKYSNNQYECLIAIECKYRSNFNKELVRVCYYNQLKSYNNFSLEKNQKVFVALGVGGKPNNPDELYIIPLDKVRCFMFRNELKNFKKENFKNSYLFYEFRNEILM